MKLRRIIGISLSLVLCMGLCACSCSTGETTSKKNASIDDILGYNPLDYVTLGQYEGIPVQLNAADYAVTDDKINDMMQSMCGNNKDISVDESKTVVTDDSIVNVDYVGQLNGVPFEGGAASDVWIDVKNNSDAETGTQYIKGFSDGIKGARVGTKADFGVTFPANYPKADLAGKYVVFTFTINSIAKDAKVELTDDYVKEHSSYQTVAQLRDAAKVQVEEEMAETKESDIRNKVLEAVVENCKVNSVPKDVVDKRVDQYLSQYKESYVEKGSSLDEYVLNNLKLSIEEFKEQVKEEVESTLKSELVYEAIAKEKNMTVDEAGFTAYAEQQAKKNGYSSIDDLFKTYGDGKDTEAGKKYLEEIYLCNMAAEFCVQKAVVTEV